MATILVLRGLTGWLRGREFAFPGPTQATVGRSHSCTVWLSGDPTVSRQHCLIELDNSGAWVQDLGSLNGTLVNGEEVGQRGQPSNDDATTIQPPRHVLEDGDELRICNNLFAVCLTETNPPGADKPAGDRASFGQCLPTVGMR